MWCNSAVVWVKIFYLVRVVWVLKEQYLFVVLASYSSHKRGKEVEDMGSSYCTVSVAVKMLPAPFIDVGEYCLFSLVFVLLLRV